MRAILKEQISRIREIMGINEQIDVDIEKDETPIIGSIERVGEVEEDGKKMPLISMVINTLIPEDGNKTPTRGFRSKIKITTKWDIVFHTKWKRYIPREHVIDIMDFQSEIPLEEKYENYIRDKFSYPNNVSDVIGGLYYPMILFIEKNGGNVERLISEEKQMEEKLRAAVYDGIEPPKEKPKYNTSKDKPTVDKSPEKPKNGLWTSTNTWDKI